MERYPPRQAHTGNLPDNPPELIWLFGFLETLKAPIKLTHVVATVWGDYIERERERDPRAITALSRLVTPDGSSFGDRGIHVVVFENLPHSLPSAMTNFTNLLDREHCERFETFDA